MQKLLRIAEVAAILGVCRETVYLWIRSRRLGSVQFGRVVRVPADELERFIAEGRQLARSVQIALLRERHARREEQETTVGSIQ